MKHTTSVYYVEVKEGKAIKRVPHTKGTKYTEFFDRKKAVGFLNKLVENNKGTSFRLCKQSTTHSPELWLNSKYERGLTDRQLANLNQ